MARCKRTEDEQEKRSQDKEMNINHNDNYHIVKPTEASSKTNKWNDYDAHILYFCSFDLFAFGENMDWN